MLGHGVFVVAAHVSIDEEREIVARAAEAFFAAVWTAKILRDGLRVFRIVGGLLVVPLAEGAEEPFAFGGEPPCNDLRNIAFIVGRFRSIFCDIVLFCRSRGRANVDADGGEAEDMTPRVEKVLVG